MRSELRKVERMQFESPLPRAVAERENGTSFTRSAPKNLIIILWYHAGIQTLAMKPNEINLYPFHS